MYAFFIICIKKFLNILYAFMKVLPVKDKIVFISRQYNCESADFRLLREALQNNKPEVTCVVLTKMIGSGLKAKICYSLHILRQMYHLSTARIAILDTYCIPACILKHRKTLTIIQMWHASGALKKFGYSVIGKKEGSDQKIALLMDMHKNYTYVSVSSKACIPFFAEAFNTSEKCMKVLPHPGLDRLRDISSRKRTVSSIYSKYPLLNSHKEKILYAPTFRKNEDMRPAINALIDAIDLEKYDLIIKLHPLTQIQISNSNIWELKEFDTIEVLPISDYIITDYSSIIFEAAFLKKPLFFYAYDLKEYLEERDFYFNYEKEVPGVVARNPHEIIEAIDKNLFDLEKVGQFAKKYIAEPSISYTGDWFDFLTDILKRK